VARDVVIPEHREVGVDHLVGSRQVHPDLEQFEGVGLLVVEQREHLGVLDPAARGHPLNVTFAVAGGRSERVGVVDESASDEGDRLESAVRMLGEAGHAGAVVHPPSVRRIEVAAEGPAVERGIGAQPAVRSGVRVEMVHAEQEGVDRWPLESERHGLEDR
jgi:hypothetical protein